MYGPIQIIHFILNNGTQIMNVGDLIYACKESNYCFEVHLQLKPTKPLETSSASVGPRILPTIKLPRDTTKMAIRPS